MEDQRGEAISRRPAPGYTFHPPALRAGEGPLTMTHELSSEQTAEFRRVFDLFDSNGDGRLTRGEIQDALEVLGQRISRADADRLLGSLDAEGAASPEAFIGWMASRGDLD